MVLFSSVYAFVTLKHCQIRSDVNKDWTCKDKDKDKDRDQA